MLPNAETVEKIGRFIGLDWLSLWVRGGYLNDVIDLIYALSRYDGSAERKLSPDGRSPRPQSIAIAYAVSSFPRRNETPPQGDLRKSFVLIHLALGTLADNARAQVTSNRNDALLINAKAVLSMIIKKNRAVDLRGTLPRDAVLAIAGEYVREWARNLDERTTHDAEKLFYGALNRTISTEEEYLQAIGAQIGPFPESPVPA